jgi:hypothetical protein
MRSKQYESIDVEPSNKAYVLSDNILAFCDQTKQRIKFFNESFEHIQTIDRINNETISPTHIESNHIDKYFIIDSKKIGNYRDTINRILVTDFNFQFIKSRHIDNIIEVKKILCYKNSIFLVDTASSEILKLNENLDALRSIQLKDSNNNFICDAKFSNDLLFVCFTTNFMNIYEPKTMRLVLKYDKFDGQLLIIDNNNLFALEYDNICYFDNNCSLMAKIPTCVFDEFTQFEIDFKIYFANKFIFYSVTRGKLIVFDANKKAMAKV